MLAASTSVPSETIMSKESTIQPWLVCLSAALFFFYEFIQMGLFNSISPELMREFNVSAAQLGNLSATYFYGDVVFLFFAGMLLDRLSPRKIILSALVLCIAATIVFALARSTWILGLSHFVSGIGNAFCFLSVIKLASRWFPAQRMALVIGLSVTLAFTGGMMAQTPLTYMVQIMSWRSAVLWDAGLGLVILFIAWWFVVDYPAGQAEQARHGQSQLHKLGMWKTAGMALRNTQNWLGGVYTSFVNLPIFLLGDLGGIMYLTQVRHIPRTEASVITTMLFVGTIIGSPLVGWLSDWWGRRRAPMFIGGVFSLLVILAIMYLPNLGFTSLFLLFLALGFFTSAQIISYPLIAESNPKMLTGTATGLASVLIMGGGAVFQPLFGWLVDLHWNGLTVNGVHVYAASDYLLGMSIMPIAFAIALIAAFFLRETRCQPFHE